MSKIQFQSVRGMRDLFGEDANGFEQLLSFIRKQMLAYGYLPFHTPILESTDLFCHSVGEGTDVVEKEMFTFNDFADSLTLRPEATAGIARAVVQHGMIFGSHRLWTIGPMFRRERPQKGRYRQFYQLSVEAFGVAEPEQDAEQLILIADLWRQLGIEDAVELRINTLATPEVRGRYRELLVNYFKECYHQLDDDSQRRLTKNPLRILDSKNPTMQEIIAAAPKLNEHLDDVSKRHFDRVLACLDNAGIAYKIDTTLVRGLDYYTHTVYEWVTSQLGSQGTICGGGRYDGLCEHIGGKPSPGVGFGLGIDRVVLLMQAVGVIDSCRQPLAYLVLLGESSKSIGLNLATAIRHHNPGQTVLPHLAESSMKAQLKKADQSGAIFAIIIGEHEIEKQTAIVKILATGEQNSVMFSELPQWLAMAIA